MAIEALSPGKRRKARRTYQVFQLFNVLSFTMLSGSVLTLFALKLGVSNLMIGVISAMVYVAFLFMILGRFTIGRIGIKRQFSVVAATEYSDDSGGPRAGGSIRR